MFSGCGRRTYVCWHVCMWVRVCACVLVCAEQMFLIIWYDGKLAFCINVIDVTCLFYFCHGFTVSIVVTVCFGSPKGVSNIYICLYMYTNSMDVSIIFHNQVLLGIKTYLCIYISSIYVCEWDCVHVKYQPRNWGHNGIQFNEYGINKFRKQQITGKEKQNHCK